MHPVIGLGLALQRQGAQVGLAPTRSNPLFEGQFSEAGAIGLYSPLLGQRQRDYPQPTMIAGFSWFDSDEGPVREMDLSLRAFLDDGAAPPVFTLGSLIVHSPGEFYRDSAAAAHSLRRRAVLLVGADQLAACAHLASPEVFVAAFAPHSQVFKRAATVGKQVMGEDGAAVAARVILGRAGRSMI